MQLTSTTCSIAHSLDVLLAMEGHEEEWQVLKTVGPFVVAVDVRLQTLAGILCEHDACQPHVSNLKAAPQRTDALRSQVKGILTDERRLATTSWTYHTWNNCRLGKVWLCQIIISITSHDLPHNWMEACCHCSRLCDATTHQPLLMS